MSRDFARQLRKNLTDAERRLWSALRYRQLGGWKFRRQAPIGPFVADFVCFERKLVIELDGAQHLEQLESDGDRSSWLVGQGFCVVRFPNHRVFEELDDVKEEIWRALGGTPHPNPPPQGGREPGKTHSARAVPLGLNLVVVPNRPGANNAWDPTVENAAPLPAALVSNREIPPNHQPPQSLRPNGTLVLENAHGSAVGWDNSARTKQPRLVAPLAAAAERRYRNNGYVIGPGNLPCLAIVPASCGWKIG